MLAFLRVMLFYLGTAALLIWAVYALGLHESLELPGFEGTRAPKATVVSVPEPKSNSEPPAKASLSREERTSEAPKTVEKAAEPPRSPAVTEVRPVEQKPADSARPAAPVSITPLPVPIAKPTETPAPVVILPVPTIQPTPSAPVQEPPRVVELPNQTPQPVVVQTPVTLPKREEPKVSPSMPPARAKEPEPAPVVVKPLPVDPPAPVVQTAPIPVPQADPQPKALPRVVDVAPIPKATVPQPRPQAPIVQTPAVQSPVVQTPSVQTPTTQAPAVQQPTVRTSSWAPARRIAGFGPDALVDQLEDSRRTSDDIPCVVLSDLKFLAGSTAMAPGTKAELQLIARILNEIPGRVEIGSRLGPGRPLDTDKILRSERARIIRNDLIVMGVAPQRMSLELDGTYERVVEDVSRARGRRVQSVGLCVLN